MSKEIEKEEVQDVPFGITEEEIEEAKKESEEK